MSNCCLPVDYLHHGKHQLLLHAWRVEGSSWTVHLQHLCHHGYWNPGKSVHPDNGSLCINEIQIQVSKYYELSNNITAPPLVLWSAILFPGSANVYYDNNHQLWVRKIMFLQQGPIKTLCHSNLVHVILIMLWFQCDIMNQKRIETIRHTFLWFF